MTDVEMMFADFIENVMMADDVSHGTLKDMIESIKSDEIVAIGLDAMRMKEFVIQTLLCGASFDVVDDLNIWTYYDAAFGMTFGDEEIDEQKNRTYRHLFQNSLPIDNPLVLNFINRLEMELL